MVLTKLTNPEGHIEYVNLEQVTRIEIHGANFHACFADGTHLEISGNDTTISGLKTAADAA